MLLVAEPIPGEDERAALSDAVDLGWITKADRVREFESASAEKNGAEDGAGSARRRQASAGGYELSEGLERLISWWRGRPVAGLARRQMEVIA